MYIVFDITLLMKYIENQKYINCYRNIKSYIFKHDKNKKYLRA